MTIVQYIPPTHSFNYEGVMMNIYHADKGQGLPKHDHFYSHATFCMTGSCVIRDKNGEIIINKHTTPVDLIELEWHEIEALEDGTVFCNVFSEAHNQPY
jgi:hypothetical protein